MTKESGYLQHVFAPGLTYSKILPLFHVFCATVSRLGPTDLLRLAVPPIPARAPGAPWQASPEPLVAVKLQGCSSLQMRKCPNELSALWC